MEPQVIAWTLMVVVGFSLVYRVIAWAGRRLNGTHRASRPRPQAEPTEARSAHSAPASRPVETQALPPKGDADAPVASDALATAAAAVAKTDSETGDTEIEDAPTLPVQAVVATEAPALPPRSAVAPSIAATLPPRIPLKASVTATLPPVAVTVIAPTIGDIAETSPEASNVLSSSASTVDAGREPSTATDTVPAPRSGRLRARRIGIELRRLDLRLRDARERSVGRQPRLIRKRGLTGAQRGLRVLAVKTKAAKRSVRRIAPNAGPGFPRASAKAKTRIIGAAQRPSRVLPAPVV